MTWLIGSLSSQYSPISALQRTCQGAYVTSRAQLPSLRFCTIINGNLSIQVEEEGTVDADYDVFLSLGEIRGCLVRSSSEANWLQISSFLTIVAGWKQWCIFEIPNASAKEPTLFCTTTTPHGRQTRWSSFVCKLNKENFSIYAILNSDNPDLLSADGILDNAVLHARSGVSFDNPKVCACSTLTPIANDLCLAVTIGQYIYFNESNVCFPIFIDAPSSI